AVGPGRGRARDIPGAGRDGLALPAARRWRAHVRSRRNPLRRTAYVTACPGLLSMAATRPLKVQGGGERPVPNAIRGFSSCKFMPCAVVRRARLRIGGTGG